MDRQEDSERSAVHRKEPSRRWYYFQFLNSTNKPNEYVENTIDDNNQESETPETANNQEVTKRNETSENIGSSNIVGPKETPKESNPLLEQETENKNAKQNSFDDTIQESETPDTPNTSEVPKSNDESENSDIDNFVGANETPSDSNVLVDQETESQDKVDDFIWLEDGSEKKKHSLKYRLRRHFLKNPEQDVVAEDFILDDSKATTEKTTQNTMKHRFIDFVAGSIDGIVRGLYAGTVPAVVASISENSVLFAAYGGCQSAVATVMDIDHVQELSVLGNACAGSLAAVFSTLTLCPTELVKCKLQAIQEMKPFVAKDSKVAAITPYQLTKQIYENEGIPGFYRGLSSTFAREIPGFFFFFGSYEATREYFTKEGESKDDIGAWKTMFAGSVGGVTLWTSTFPADVIKSRIQIKNLKSSMMTVAIDIVRKEGVLALYNGLLPSILRTIPATATLFLVYEYTKKIMNNYL